MVGNAGSIADREQLKNPRVGGIGGRRGQLGRNVARTVCVAWTARSCITPLLAISPFVFCSSGASYLNGLFETSVIRPPASRRIASGPHVSHKCVRLPVCI